MTTKEVLNFTREDGLELFNSKKTDKEIYDALVKKGLTDDFETFTSEILNVFNEKIANMSKEEILTQIEGAELTDEQLEMIAGGAKSTGETVGIAVGATVGGAAALAGIGYTVAAAIMLSAC